MTRAMQAGQEHLPAGVWIPASLDEWLTIMTPGLSEAAIDQIVPAERAKFSAEVEARIQAGASAAAAERAALGHLGSPSAARKDYLKTYLSATEAERLANFDKLQTVLSRVLGYVVFYFLLSALRGDFLFYSPTLGMILLIICTGFLIQSIIGRRRSRLDAYIASEAFYRILYSTILVLVCTFLIYICVFESQSPAPIKIIFVIGQVYVFYNVIYRWIWRPKIKFWRKIRSGAV